MNTYDALSACEKAVDLIESEPEEIGHYMKGEIADEYKKLLQKELTEMRDIKSQIQLLMIKM